MEYLSGRPGFFETYPTKKILSPLTSIVVTRPSSSSASSGSEQTVPQKTNSTAPVYIGKPQTTLNLQPSPYYQKPNPLPSLAYSRPQANPINLRPSPYYQRPNPLPSSTEPRPQPNAMVLRPPFRPAASSPLPVNQLSFTGGHLQPAPLGQPQDTTNAQIHKWLDVWKQFQDQTSQINQSFADPTGGSASTFAVPTSDPTGGSLSGVDPSGLFVPGGGMAIPIDPSTVLSAGIQMGGFDPTGVSYGCTIM